MFRSFQQAYEKKKSEIPSNVYVCNIKIEMEM